MAYSHLHFVGMLISCLSLDGLPVSSPAFGTCLLLHSYRRTLQPVLSYPGDNYGGKNGAGVQAPNTEGWVDPNSKTKKPKKNIDFSLHSLWGLGAPPVIKPEVFTASGTPIYTPILAPILSPPRSPPSNFPPCLCPPSFLSILLPCVLPLPQFAFKRQPLPLQSPLPMLPCSAMTTRFVLANWSA